MAIYSKQRAINQVASHFKKVVWERVITGQAGMRWDIVVGKVQYEII